MTGRCLDPICTDGPTENDEARPRWAATPSLLCVRCGNLLEQRIAEIPAQVDALRMTLGGLHGSQKGENRPTKGTPPVPLNIAAHDHLTAMNATVVSWVRLVCEERGLRGPGRADVEPLSAWLLSQLPWLLEHDAVGDLADEIRDLTRTAEGITRRTRQPVRAGADCFECGGDLIRRVTTMTVEVSLPVPWQWWLPGSVGPMPAPDDRASRTGGIEEDRLTCTQCGQTYDGGQYLMALKAAAWEAARVEVDGETWATPASLATDLGRPENTLKRWRRDGLVRVLVLSGVTFFHVGDVEAEHETRGVRRSA